MVIGYYILIKIHRYLLFKTIQPWLHVVIKKIIILLSNYVFLSIWLWLLKDILTLYDV